MTKQCGRSNPGAMDGAAVTTAARGEAIFDRRKVAPGAGHNSEDCRAKKELLVTTYRRFRKEEGEHYVQRCRLVVEAKDLPPDLYLEFCDDVDLPRDSSMFRKARTIAKAADRLLAVSNRLPDSKSTIYELAKLDESVFGELVDTDVLTPRITAAQVKGTSPEGTTKQERCVVPIDVTALGHGERLELLEEVQATAARYGATIKVPKSLLERQVGP
jgi:hypothetical protein